FDVSAGRIAIDGLDIGQMTLASLRANIGVVLQEPYLLARSAADNLRIGKPDASEAEIARALALAQADFVADPQAAIGERGCRRRWRARGAAAPRSSSPTGCRRSVTPT